MAQLKRMIRMRLAIRKPIDSTGFRAPTQRPLGNERRSVVLAELVATLALAVSTMVTATVLTVGIARASAVDSVIDNEGSLFGVALLLGLIFIGLGGFAFLAGGKAK
jgi:hypothetical protein